MNIKDTIKKHGFNITGVATEMGITRETLTRNISGNPTYKTMKQVADVIGANVSEFFEDEIKNPKEDFAAFVRYKGIHWTADNLEDWRKLVDEVNTIAK